MKLLSLPVIKKGATYTINGKRLTYVECEERYSYLRYAGCDNPDRNPVILYTFKDSSGNELYYHSDEELDILPPSESQISSVLGLVGITMIGALGFWLISFCVRNF